MLKKISFLITLSFKYFNLLSLTVGSVFFFQPLSLAVEEVDSIGDIYPGLDLGDLPGSVIRWEFR